MKSIESIAAGNEAYHALQAAPDSTDPSAETYRHIIANITPVYHKVGASVCRELTELTGDDPDYAPSDYLVATYDALSSVAADESLADISRRALRRLYSPDPNLIPVPAPPEITAITTPETDGLVTDERDEAAATVRIEDSTSAETEFDEEAPVKEHQPLTLEQKIERDYELCQRVAAGDQDAATELLSRYHRLLLRQSNLIGRKIKTGAISFEDIYQEAAIYTLQQAPKYSPRHGMTFLGYVSAFMPQRLQKVLGQQYGVHIPDDVQTMLNNVEMLNSFRAGARQGIVTDAQMAREFGLREGAPTDTGARTTGNLRQALLLTKYLGSTNLGFSPQAEDSPGNDYFLTSVAGVRSITSGEVPDPQEAVENEELARELQEVLETLSEREAGVMRLMFGLVDGQTHTLDEIGQVYGVTRERIRQIEKKTLNKLRHPARSQKLRDYLGDRDAERAHVLEIRRAREDEERIAHNQEQQALKARKEAQADYGMLGPHSPDETTGELPA